jgi:hypothetical protein
LTAIARTEGILYEVSPGGDMSLKINGVDVSWTPASAPGTAGVAAINAVSKQTGVTAEYANEYTAIYLIDEDGDDIVVQNMGSSANARVVPIHAYTRVSSLILSPFGYYQTLDPSGTDTIRLTGTTLVNSDGYAEVSTTDTGSSVTNTYGFTERARFDNNESTIQIGTEQGQSIDLNVDILKASKLGGEQVIRTSINIYDDASGGQSLSGAQGQTPPHHPASFKIIDSVGNSYEVDLNADSSYSSFGYGSLFNWN